MKYRVKHTVKVIYYYDVEAESDEESGLPILTRDKEVEE